MKLPNPYALEALVEARAATPFAWGTSDCAMWAFDAVLAFTGRDPAADLRGAYSTQHQALRLVVAEGRWPAICARRIGPAVLPAEAQTGDVMQLHPAHLDDDLAGIGALAVVLHGQLVAQAEHGLVRLPMHVGLGCWRAT